MMNTDSNPVHNDHFVITDKILKTHGAFAAGDYTAGRFIIRLFGANPDGLE